MINPLPYESRIKSNISIFLLLNLMSYLKIYLKTAEMTGNKHIGYFYDKENFMADTIQLKLR